jgi:hypothetical protein
VQRPPLHALRAFLLRTDCEGCGRYVFKVIGALEFFDDVQVFLVDTFPDDALDVILNFRQLLSHSHDFRFSFLKYQ